MLTINRHQPEETERERQLRRDALLEYGAVIADAVLSRTGIEAWSTRHGIRADHTQEPTRVISN